MAGTSATTDSAPETPAAQPAAPKPTDVGPRLGFQNGDFVAGFGNLEYRLNAQQLAQKEIDLQALPQPVPGLRFRTAKYDKWDKVLKITAGVAVPHLAAGDVTVTVDSKGKPAFHGKIHRKFDLPALGPAAVSLELDEAQALTGTAEIHATDLAPKSIPRLKATGSGNVTLAAGKLSGSGTINLTYTDLGNGEVSFAFDQTGGFSASGKLHLTPPFMEEITGDFSVDTAGNIVANATVAINASKSPVPNLTLSAGSLTLGYMNGKPSLEMTGFGAEYAGFGSVTIESLALDSQNHPKGKGSFTLNIPMLTEAKGDVSVAGGQVSGSLTIGKDNFPKGLPIKSGTLTGKLAQGGALSFSGAMLVDFGPAGTADIKASYGPEGFAIAGEADLKVPGLNPVHLTAKYAKGDLSGEVQVPVDNALIPGLSGNVTIRYAEGRWSGETTLAYSADDGKLSGTVTVTVAQNDKGAIELGGKGAVTAQLMPGLKGTLTAAILPEGGVDVSGEIVVTEPYQLFPEQRLDKVLLNYSQSIPLWAILVAIIRLRAGVRAGIGPGVFRDIKVTGSYTLGSDKADPSFTITGEMYIPAFVEGYVSFGAGLGLDVVLGSLTGGIEGVATAGIYGAISVVPELSYEGGNWSIDGTATMAAGARLKLGLNAWAEVEALWITVWENTWNLAEFVMPIGPDLALQAHMHYTFGQPTPPELDFKTSDIDSDKLISDAMPKDGPPASGAREALQNKAEWKGKLREKREPPAPPPAAAPAPPAAKAKPPKKQKPGGGAKATGPGPNTDPGASPTPGNEADRSKAVNEAAKPDPKAAGTVPDSKLPNAGKPRFPEGISLKMLDDPPVPAERTATQQKEDLDAAAKVIDLARAQSSDTDALDNYFPRIKDRFRLTSLGYEGDFHKGFDVAGKINPDFKIKVNEPISGRGLPLGLDRATEIVHGETSLGGDVVGMTMKAKPLGPEHPAGSGPTGQRQLMDKLPTGYKENPDANSNYIQGHLLNDWLGGMGKDYNLFPITQHANSLHSSGIEETVKEWVNKRRFWVNYEVSIAVADYDLKLGKADNFVDSTITAKAYVLNTELKPAAGLSREVTIASTFKHPAHLKTDLTDAKKTKQEVAADKLETQSRKDRPEDRAFDVLGTNRANAAADDITFPEDMEKAVKKLGGRSKAEPKLLAHPGIGPALNAAFWKAYEKINRRSDKTLTSLELDPDEKALFRTVVTLWHSGPPPF